MGINSGLKRGSGNWPWSALGIAQTTDKTTIRAAYDIERAKLDAEAMRISAFAELTEAREKALFLASELLREAVRSGESVGDLATTEVERQFDQSIDIASPSEEPPAEPEPEPEPQPEWERGGRFASNETIVASFGLQDEDEDEIERREAKVDQFWEAERGFGGQPPSDAPTPFIERYSLQKYWPLWVFGFVFMLSFCSDGDDSIPPSSRPSNEVSAPITQVVPPAAELSEADQLRAEAMVAELFGQQFTYAELFSQDYRFATGLMERLPSDSENNEDSRAHLRARILRSRSYATQEQALAIAELHLAWLQTAQAEGDGACREVTSELFFNGIPAMRADWIGFEQSVAGVLLRSGYLSRRQVSDASLRGALPPWVFAAAQEQSGLEGDTIRAALANVVHPARCETEIALLQAMLARPDDLTSAMLASI